MLCSACRYPLPAAHLERAKAAVPSCRQAYGSPPDPGLQEGEAPAFMTDWSGKRNGALVNLILVLCTKLRILPSRQTGPARETQLS